jgi:hypothetical protein
MPAGDAAANIRSVLENAPTETLLRQALADVAGILDVMIVDDAAAILVAGIENARAAEAETPGATEYAVSFSVAILRSSSKGDDILNAMPPDYYFILSSNL